MRPRSILALSNFFAVAHFYLIVYIITPYLATMIVDSTSALSVALGAIVTLSVFPYLPKIVSKYGPQRTAIIFAGIEGVLLLLLSTYPSPLFAVLLVALSCAVPPLILYPLDLLIEACVDDERATGRVRTAFNTAGNLALIFSPLIVGILLDGSDEYGLVFMAAALSIIPFILLMFTRSLPQVAAPTLHNIRVTAAGIMADRDQRAAALSNLVLQFFFHVVPLYIPLYLHTVLGVPWSSLGWILAVTLVPFVLLEYPVGWLADRKYGDVMFLAAGFVIAGLSFACLSFVTINTPLYVILLILLFMRIGGSFIEAMTEAHFFRRISSNDSEAVSLFRMMRPLGALITPIIGTIILSATTYGGLFLISGFSVLIAGLACAYSIRATMPLVPEVKKRITSRVSTVRC